MRARPLIGASLLAVSAVALASCASSTNADADASAGGTTVEHALGTTTVPEKAERVATVGWGNQDVALALGVAPVGVDDQTWSWDMSDGLGIYDWTIDAYEELGADEPVIFDTTDGTDFTAIADTQPDLVLAGYSGLTEEDYATLTDIAPTVAYPDIPWYTPWRDSILINSKGLNLAEEGEQLVADLDAQIEDATADVTSFEGKTAAFFYVSPSDLSTVSVYGVDDSRTAFLGDLGFDAPQVAIDTSDTGVFYADISAENADKLSDVDVIVTYGDDATVKALQDDKLWGTVPAVENGAVVTVGNGDAFSGAVTPTALSIPWMLDDYVGLLDEAATAADGE